MANTQKLPRHIKWLLAALSMGILWGIGATLLLLKSFNETLTLPPNTDPLKIESNFIPAQCPTDAALNQGMTWRDITIGVSSALPIIELYGVQFSFQGPPTWAHEGFARAYDVLLTPERTEELGIPSGISFCMIGNTILALTIGIPQDGTFPTGYIDEWVAKYGVPEIVTWIEGTSDWCSRTLVWPQLGMAVDFDVFALKEHPLVSWAGSVTLFPYAEGQDYLTTWPYNDFLDNKSPSGNNLDGCPTEQNPFNFEEILNSRAV